MHRNCYGNDRLIGVHSNCGGAVYSLTLSGDKEFMANTKLPTNFVFCMLCYKNTVKHGAITYMPLNQ